MKSSMKPSQIETKDAPSIGESDVQYPPKDNPPTLAGVIIAFFVGAAAAVVAIAISQFLRS